METKKVIAVVVSLFLGISLLAGCEKSKDAAQIKEGGSQTAVTDEALADAEKEGSAIDKRDMVTIKYVMLAASNMSDSKQVEEAVNKILAEKWGIQMELIFIDYGVWTESMNLMLTGSDEVDVFMLYQTPLSTYANNGQLLPLDYYYENSSDAFKAIWSEEDLASIRVRGTLYSIRNFKNDANYVSINMNTQLVEEMGINPNEINSLEAVEELLYRVQKEYPDIYPLVPQASDVMTGTWTWDGLGDSKYLGVLEDCGQSEEIKNLFETDDFIDFCTTMRDWYTNGLIMSDALSNTESGLTMVQNGKAFAYFNNSTPAEIEGIVKAELISAWSKSGTYSSIGYGINANTKYPDESWKLMEALYTDKDIINILVNGIEDVHWVYANEEKTLLTYPDGVDSSSAKYNGGLMYWSFPYARFTIPWAPSSPLFYEDMEEFNATALKSKGVGMIFDSVNVSNEVTACTNIMAKYYNALMCGTLEVESTIATANEEFKAAGLDLIIAEKQLQLEKAKVVTE